MYSARSRIRLPKGKIVNGAGETCGNIYSAFLFSLGEYRSNFCINGRARLRRDVPIQQQVLAEICLP